MKKTLLWNVIVIVVVIALTATATWAYFGSVDSNAVRITTARIGIDGVYGFNMLYENLLPGIPQAKEIHVKNTSNVPADFYVQLVPQNPTNETNFCYPDDLAEIKITQLTGANAGYVWYHGSVCPLYTIVADPQIPMIGNDIPADVTIAYQVELYLKPATTSKYANKFNDDTINLIAVQYNGTAPDGVHDQIWPAGDPLYAP